MRTVYVNGQFLPIEQATLPIMDRGFLFGDGIYEVSAVLDGKLVDNAAHLARLERSLGEIRLACPVPFDDMPALQEELIARNQLTEGVVYMQVTRGPAERDFAFPGDPKPTLVMFTQPKNIIDSPAGRDGALVVTTDEIRWRRRDIKSVSLLAQVMAKQVAAEAGAYEAWMVEDGEVTEGSSSTAFILNDAGDLVTRKTDTSVLAGVTRKAVLALAAETDLRIDERRFTLDEAYAAREAFLTSASSFVIPITRINNRTVGDGRPGPVAKRLRELYVQFARGER